MRSIVKWHFGAAVLLLTLTLKTYPSFSADLQRCLGAICIGEKALTYRDIKTRCRLQKAKVGMGVDQKRSLCAYEKQADVSAVLSFSGDQPLDTSRVDSIFLAQGMLCESTAAKPKSCLDWRTESGLHIGQSKEKVLELLGTPSRTDDAVAREKHNPKYRQSRYASAYGALRLHYEEGPHSLLFNQFGVNEDGMIASIWLNNSE
jgi:hypothetical protein